MSVNGKYRGLRCYNGVVDEMENDMVGDTGKRNLFDTILQDLK